MKSDTPAAFNNVTALWRNEWNEISLTSREIFERAHLLRNV